MDTYVVLLRGINVGGNNRVPMAELRACLSDLGYEDVRTYIASGNVVLRAAESASAVTDQIEAALRERFQLSAAAGRVLVVSAERYRKLIASAPAGFGSQPDTYHSDVIFLLDITAADAAKVFHPRDGVDELHTARGVLFHQRLSAERTRSRMSAIVGTPAYRSMTVRNWNTATRLLAMIDGTA